MAIIRRNTTNDELWEVVENIMGLVGASFVMALWLAFYVLVFVVRGGD